MKFNIKITKSSIYATANFREFLLYDSKTRGWRKMTDLELNNKTAYKEASGWEEITAETIDEAWSIRSKKIKELRVKRAEEQAKFNSLEDERTELLLKLDVIPTTIENLKLIMKRLNKQNWGSWKLPLMSIGYIAHQYDCDGITATTFKLDKSLDGQTKFKVGGKRGHLNNYIQI